jgi:hypothetical protein
VPDHCDLLRYIADADDFSKFSRGEGYLVSTHRVSDVSVPLLRRVEFDSIDQVEVTHADYTGSSMYRDLYQYRMSTISGDCGAPLFLSNNYVKHKLIGVHVAGATGDDVGMAERLDKVSIEQALKRFDMAAQVCFEPEDCAYITETQIDLDFDGDAATLCMDNTVPVLGTIPFGVGTPPRLATETKFKPSLIYGEMATPTQKPAYLKPTIINGEKIDPLIKGLKKVAINNPHIDQDLIDQAKASIMEDFYNYADDKRRRVYSLEEAAFGVEGDVYVEPINRKTSPGYPYVLTRTLPGKEQWLGKGDEKFISDDIRADVEKMISDAKQNIRVPVCYMDVLKDETRPIEKVDEGKTRVFAVGNLTHTLAVRQYYLGVVAHTMATRIINECAIGINPASREWHTLAKSFKFHNRMVAGDFSNFDGSLVLAILWAINDILEGFYYDATPEEKQVRRVLFASIVNSLHIVNGKVYLWTHSQTSGNPLTTLINCLFVKMVMRMAWIKCGGDVREFRRYVNLISYGDDNALSVHPNAPEAFNQEGITQALAELGLTYTDESKSGKTYIFRNLSEITFLKRSFRYEPLFDACVAPLEPAVMDSMMDWTHGQHDPKSQVLANADTYIREMCMQEPAIWEDKTERLRTVLAKQGLSIFLATREYHLHELEKHPFQY